MQNNPGAAGDFKHFCEVTGHRLLGHRVGDDGVLVFEIEKAAEKV